MQKGRCASRGTRVRRNQQASQRHACLRQSRRYRPCASRCQPVDHRSARETGRQGDEEQGGACVTLGRTGLSCSARGPSRNTHTAADRASQGVSSRANRTPPAHARVAAQLRQARVANAHIVRLLQPRTVAALRLAALGAVVVPARFAGVRLAGQPAAAARRRRARQAAQRPVHRGRQEEAGVACREGVQVAERKVAVRVRAAQVAERKVTGQRHGARSARAVAITYRLPAARAAGRRRRRSEFHTFGRESDTHTVALCIDGGAHLAPQRSPRAVRASDAGAGARRGAWRGLAATRARLRPPPALARRASAPHGVFCTLTQVTRQAARWSRRYAATAKRRLTPRCVRCALSRFCCR